MSLIYFYILFYSLEFGRTWNLFQVVNVLPAFCQEAQSRYTRLRNTGTGTNM